MLTDPEVKADTPRQAYVELTLFSQMLDRVQMFSPTNENRL